jgi:uncharacterized protein
MLAFQPSIFNYQPMLEIARRRTLGAKELVVPPHEAGAFWFAMKQKNYRAAIVAYIRSNANPPDKFSHQARLYQLASELAEREPYDDDVLYAAAWMHDLGVFIGHRPEEADELRTWDHIAYAARVVPDILKSSGFPEHKIPAVIEVIKTHLPSSEPVTFEGILLRDADILEQLGAVGILRTVSKVGRDTRFVRFSDALHVLRKNAEELPARLKLRSAHRRAQSRLKILAQFLTEAESEGNHLEW